MRFNQSLNLVCHSIATRKENLLIEFIFRKLWRLYITKVLEAFSFFLGSVVNAIAETGRVDRLSGGKCRSSDLQTAYRELIQYSTGAFMSLARIDLDKGSS